MHNYSFATHSRKLLKGTKKGTRNVPKGGPIVMLNHKHSLWLGKPCSRWRQEMWVRIRVILHQPSFAYSF